MLALLGLLRRGCWKPDIESEKSMKKTAAVSPLGRIPGQAYLWLAVIIFAAASSITRKLTEIGSQI